MVAWGSDRTGLNGMQLQPRVQPWRPDRDLAGYSVARSPMAKYATIYDKPYTALYLSITDEQGGHPELDSNQQPYDLRSNSLARRSSTVFVSTR
jgi:hypothetical protein